MMHTIWNSGVIFLLGLLVLGCSQKEVRPTEMKVGMTYDEVESLMGKPDLINRGVNELHFTGSLVPEDADLDYKEAFATFFADSGFDRSWDSTQLFKQPELQNVASLMVVAWVFMSKVDTISGYRIVPKFESVSRTITRKRRVDIDGFLFTEAEALKSWGPAFRDFPNLKMLPATEVVKGWKLKRVDRPPYKILRPYTVLFDASSGRARSFDHHPLYIVQ